MRAFAALRRLDAQSQLPKRVNCSCECVRPHALGYLAKHWHELAKHFRAAFPCLNYLQADKKALELLETKKTLRNWQITEIPGVQDASP